MEEGSGVRMTDFGVSTTVENGRAVVAVAGECDLASREELASALLAAVERAPVVVVDVAALRFLDSSGLHGLVSAHRAAQDRGGRVYLVNAGGPVASVLDLTGVGELLRPPVEWPHD